MVFYTKSLRNQVQKALPHFLPFPLVAVEISMLVQISQILQII